MKVNFNVYFKDFDGSVLLIDKKPQCMGVIVSQCLFNGTGFRPSGNIQTDNEKKLHGYDLCILGELPFDRLDIALTVFA